MSGLAVALIGGGRWGRTHAAVLSQLFDRVDRVLWVSRHNGEALSAHLAELTEARDRFALLPSLDAALASQPDAAIVATPAADHAGTAEILLRHGVPTLVEKPLALSVESARSLVDLATGRGVPLLVGLHLLEAPFLRYFLRMLDGRAVARVELEWLDPEQEVRHGIVKASNLTTHKVDEIMPHLWSMLRLIDDSAEPHVRVIKPLALGAVEVEVDLGRSRAILRFGRRAAERKRSIRLAFRDGGSAELDFTIEPGRIAIDGAARPSYDGAGKFGPLAVEQSKFLDIVRGKQDLSSSLQLASRCVGSVELAEVVRARLIVEEAGAVATHLAHGGSVRDPDISAWIIDNIAPLLAGREPGTESEREDRTNFIVDAIASGNASPKVRDDKLRAMLTTIWKSDFFANLTHGRSD
jgi:hypothetical protein